MFVWLIVRLVGSKQVAGSVHPSTDDDSMQRPVSVGFSPHEIPTSEKRETRTQDR